MIRSTVQRLARSAGVSITRFPPRESLAFQLRLLFERLSVNVVLDVGANDGQYVQLLRTVVGYDGRIVSFEPSSRSYAALVRKWGSDARWTGWHGALGERSGEAELHAFARPMFDSLLEPNDFGLARFVGLAEPQGTERVEVRSLGDVFGDVTRGLEDPRAHLKVDTQGLDLAVLRGALGVLDRVVSIQIELSLKPIYEGQPRWLETIEELEGLGYEVTGMFPVSRDADGLAVVEFDCTLRRRPS